MHRRSNAKGFRRRDTRGSGPLAAGLVVTGANGFVGRHLLPFAAARGFDAWGTVRTAAGARRVQEAGGRAKVVPDLGAPALVDAFRDAEVVVHLAHIGSERGATFEEVNVAGTRAVAAAARAANVRRLVLFSGLGVARYGLARHTTNRYFLSKLGAEREAYQSGLEVVALRPSYIVGPGDEVLPPLLAAIQAGEVEQAGDGSYRLQPVALADAVEVALAAAWRTDLFAGKAPHRVLDLVGPEPIRFDDFVRRLAAVLASLGRGRPFRQRVVPLAEAEARATAGGFLGMGPESLDCLLCDEVSDAAPVAAVLGRPLHPLEDALRDALL